LGRPPEANFKKSELSPEANSGGWKPVAHSSGLRGHLIEVKAEEFCPTILSISQPQLQLGRPTDAKWKKVGCDL